MFSQKELCVYTKWRMMRCFRSQLRQVGARSKMWRTGASAWFAHLQRPENPPEVSLVVTTGGEEWCCYALARLPVQREVEECFKLSPRGALSSLHPESFQHYRWPEQHQTFGKTTHLKYRRKIRRYDTTPQNEFACITTRVFEARFSSLIDCASLQWAAYVQSQITTELARSVYLGLASATRLTHNMVRNGQHHGLTIHVSLWIQCSWLQITGKVSGVNVGRSECLLKP